MKKQQEKVNEKTARKNILRQSHETDEEKSLPTVKGYDFNKKFNLNKFIDSFGTTGAQATHLSKAIEIIKKMKKDNAFIYLGYTSNQVTTGNRELIRYLVEHKLVDVLVTTSGGIEEDIIKCLGGFKIGSFKANSNKLRDKGINRAGNIFIPNSRYCDFEDWIIPILEEIYKIQKQSNNQEIISPSKLIKILGSKINNKDSIYYHAQKNNIPVFCPAPTDGSLGDMIYFFKSKNPDFKLDVSEDIVEINNSTIGKKKTGIIILGAGVIKHHICNANMFRNGADYAVYVNTSNEFDGSDSGAKPSEAITWGKIAKNAESIKVYADATIILPLLIASGAFNKK